MVPTMESLMVAAVAMGVIVIALLISSVSGTHHPHHSH
jgi:hypothetical protein